MCGFSGFLNPSGTDATRSIDALKKMGSAIANRGPDSSGEWLSEGGKVGLSHRRLSIVDLSPAGHQPMESLSSRYVMAFNGEIYNHLELRSEIERESGPVHWNGHSDTETLLSCFEFWGVPTTVKKAIGMFAFAVWDKHEEKLILGRDRLGEKPLYYGWQNSVFLFGSELKSLKIHPAFSANISRDAITLLLRHNYIPAPYSIYEGVSKLLPGCIFELNLSDRKQTIKKYWSAADVFESGKKAKRLSSSPENTVNDLELILKSAVKQQMMADVPLGAFLSGGVDSSTIVALMQSQSETPIKTFSIGFHEDGYNEAEHAKLVAEHLGTDHTELYVTSEDAIKVIPLLATIYDEPFSDSSQIPTYLVSKMAREHVTVSLSGDGGDEIFCGYNRYLMTSSLWGKLSKIPLPLRRIISVLLVKIPVKSWSFLNKLLPQNLKMKHLGDKMHKAAGVISSLSVFDLYKGLVSHWNDPEAIVKGGKEPKTALTDKGRRPQLNNDIEQMMALDTISYLPDDILVKVDRASMGVSLESRVPFLNHKVVEFAWSLPLDHKLRSGVSKWCLKEVLYRHVPRELIERPKMGFGVPIDIWLRGPLREWAESLLAEKRLLEEGFFHPEPIRKMWTEHLSGKRNWQYQLWDVLMFQSWYEENK